MQRITSRCIVQPRTGDVVMSVRETGFGWPPGSGACSPSKHVPYLDILAHLLAISGPTFPYFLNPEVLFAIGLPVRENPRRFLLSLPYSHDIARDRHGPGLVRALLLFVDYVGALVLSRGLALALAWQLQWASSDTLRGLSSRACSWW
jgi:hypothetical protein